MAEYNKPPTLTHCGSRKLLRRLELEAYASVVSAFRAQGHLSREKKASLEHLSKCLGISLERHRAEIRRAVNDDVLSRIADSISGADTEKAWRREGQKLLSGLPPRLVSHSHPPVLPQALTAITAATHTLGPAVVGSSSSNMGQASAEASRKVPMPIQNALRVILSSVSKTEPAPGLAGGGGKPPKAASSRGVQKSHGTSGGAVKEEPSDGAGTRASPSRNVLPDAGKIYSQLESLLCEEQLNLSKGSSEEGDDGDKMVTEVEEKSERDLASSPSRPSRGKANQDGSAGGSVQTGADKVKTTQEGGSSEGEENTDGLSDAGKTISDLISRISRKRQSSPVQASDLPPAKKKAVQASTSESAGSVKSRVTVSPLVSRSTAATGGKVVAVSTPSGSKVSIQSSVKTSPATSRAISILRAVATSKTAASSSKGTSTMSTKLPVGSKAPSPAKSQAGSSGVQVIPISGQTDPAFSQAIETLNKALNSLNKAGISSLSAVSPAAAALISRKSSPLRSLSPSHRATTSTVANSRTLSGKDDNQRPTLPSSSQTTQTSQSHAVPIQSQGLLSSSSQQPLDIPPTTVQPADPVLPKAQQLQKALPPAVKLPKPLPQQAPKPHPQQTQERMVQANKEVVPQVQPLLQENGEIESAATIDQASAMQSLGPSHKQQEMLSLAARLLQEALSQAAVSKSSDTNPALSRSGQQLLTAPSVAMASQQTGMLEGVASRQTVSKDQQSSQLTRQTVSSQQTLEPLPLQSLEALHKPVSSQSPQKPSLSQTLQESVSSQTLHQDLVPTKETALPSLDEVPAKGEAPLHPSQDLVPQKPVPSTQSEQPSLLPQPAQSEPTVSQQLPVSATPVFTTSEQTKVLQMITSSPSQQYGRPINVHQVPNQGNVYSLQAPDSIIQQQTAVSSQPPSAPHPISLPVLATHPQHLPTASSQPYLTAPLQIASVISSQQASTNTQGTSVTCNPDHTPAILSTLPSHPPGPSAVSSQAQILETFNKPLKTSEQQPEQLLVSSLGLPQPTPSQATGLSDSQMTVSDLVQQPEGPQRPLSLVEPSVPSSLPVQPLLSVAPQVAQQPDTSMLENAEKLAAGVDSSESLNISDLIQDTSDSTVSSLASQLAGLENAIPLLNMDLMAFLQPTTPDSPADALPMFPSTPELPKMESMPVLPGSTGPSSSHLDSPVVSTPLVLGHSPLAPSFDDTSLNTATHPSGESSESVLEISTLATSKDVSAAKGSGRQGNPVPSSPAEYLDLDISSLMDPSKLLEGIPEDMAKSIQTIVQLDEETWK